MEPIITTLPEPASTPIALEDLPPNRKALLELGEIPRVLGRHTGDPGATLIVVAGVHGNEPSGVIALRRVLDRLEEARPQLRGTIHGLAGNLAALAQGVRYLDEDLNRLWHPDRLAQVRQGIVRSAEDRQLQDLDKEIELARTRATGPVFILDLHTASGPGPAFTVLDDTLPNRAFALELGMPVVLGIEEELQGTLMNHVSAEGLTGVGFEGGQHENPRAVDRAESAIWVALQVAGILGQDFPEILRAHELLRDDGEGLPEVVEVLYRHPISPQDQFTICPGLSGFERVDRDQLVAQDRKGEVRAPEGGMLLMPLYQAQGNEGFFLVRPVHPAWLKVSELARRGNLENVLHWLPGVERHPEISDTFRVDRRWARFGALQAFHLLGFRRVGPRDDRVLIFTRRPDR